MTKTLIRVVAAIALAVSAVGVLPQTSAAEQQELTPRQQQELKNYAHDLCSEGGGTWSETENTYSCSEADGDWEVSVTCVLNTGTCDTWETPPSAAGQRVGNSVYLATVAGLLKGRRSVLVRAAPVVAPIAGPRQR